MTQSWSPRAAPHVVGRYAERRFGEGGLPLPQAFLCKCSVCGASWASICTSGAIRSHIVQFAAKHLHLEDSLAAPVVRRPGSLLVKRGPDGEYVKVEA